MALELHVGDVVRLKKPHPCGSYQWEIYRVGADIGLTCQRCQRRLLLPRSTVERRAREVLPQQRPPPESLGLL